MMISLDSVNLVSDEDIFSVQTNIKIDEMAASLPIDELKATIRWNKTNDPPLGYNSKIVLFQRTKQLGIYYCRNITKTDLDIYTFEGVSSVGILADANFPGKFFARGTVFSDAVDQIINDEIQYEFDDESQDFDIYEGFIGHCSKREAIRHLCISNGVVVYNGSGKLHFRRMFGGILSDTRYDRFSYQQNQVFDDYIIEDVDRYSHYSVDIYQFSTDFERDQYVTDPSTGKKYYYLTEKSTYVNPDYPADKPKNELYIQNEMLISSNSAAGELLGNLARYYSGGKTLKFRVISDEPKNLGVGFYDNTEMLFGYPAETQINYAIDKVEGNTHSISYVCNMAYTEEPRFITINYKNEAGEILTSQRIVKGSEDIFEVQHPVITVAIDTKHKAVYIAPKKTTTYSDDAFYDPNDIDVICKLAAIQTGNKIQINCADYADQEDDKLYIRGKNYV